MHIIFLLFLLSSCDISAPETESKKVAEVGAAVLYQYELEELLKNNTARDDSATIVSAFISSWVQNQVIIQEAKSMLSQEKQDFSEKVEDYRNSLLIYAFEKELLIQVSDTIITNEEIENFYEEHQAQFKLGKPLIKYKLVIADAESDDKSKLEKLIGSDDAKKKEKLEDFCLQYAYSYDLTDSTWVYLDAATSSIPGNFTKDLKIHGLPRTQSWTDSNYFYVLRIRDYLAPGKPSPLSFEQEKIKNILKIKRKKEYLNRYYQELYNDAEDSKAFRIYYEDN